MKCIELCREQKSVTTQTCILISCYHSHRMFWVVMFSFPQCNTSLKHKALSPTLSSPLEAEILSKPATPSGSQWRQWRSPEQRRGSHHRRCTHRRSSFSCYHCEPASGTGACPDPRPSLHLCLPPTCGWRAVLPPTPATGHLHHRDAGKSLRWLFDLLSWGGFADISTYRCITSVVPIPCLRFWYYIDISALNISHYDILISVLQMTHYYFYYLFGSVEKNLHQVMLLKLEY